MLNSSASSSTVSGSPISSSADNYILASRLESPGGGPQPVLNFSDPLIPWQSLDNSNQSRYYHSPSLMTAPPQMSSPPPPPHHFQVVNSSTPLLSPPAQATWRRRPLCDVIMEEENLQLYDTPRGSGGGPDAAFLKPRTLRTRPMPPPRVSSRNSNSSGGCGMPTASPNVGGGKRVAPAESSAFNSSLIRANDGHLKNKVPKDRSGPHLCNIFAFEITFCINTPLSTFKLTKQILW